MIGPGRHRAALTGLAVFILAWAHGATLGVSDDEAYYWVLSRQLDWGYAYHPPAVAWLIAASRFLWGGLLGQASSAVIRFPAALILGLVSAWSLDRRRASILFSFWGFFGAAWMMVPDLPLFLGWMIVFRAALRGNGPGLLAGVCVALQSKYSGVLIALSAATWLAAHRRWRPLLWVAAGCVLGAAPILWWNWQTGWESLGYQLSGRHSGHPSVVRWLRFWLVEILLAGPPLIFFALRQAVTWVRSKGTRAGADVDESLLLFLMFPPLVAFGVQPLFGEFKLHWAFVAWWPALLLAARRGLGGGWAERFQIAWGMTLLVGVLVAARVPWVTALTGSPLQDVTNDLFGWSELGERLAREQGEEPESGGWPVIGSRYQTAAQASVALEGSGRLVTLHPQTPRDKREWPSFGDQAWRKGLFFVADERYAAPPPPFEGLACIEREPIAVKRMGLPSKTIHIWRCRPEAAKIPSS